MSAPYVSIRRLVGNSFSAMLSAIEIYNKPQLMYREEVAVILLVNAWELALKASLRQDGRSIFYKKKRGQDYRSLTIDDSLKQVAANNLWPTNIDGHAITANIKALSEYRNLAIHLYNAQGLASIIYTFLQQNVINYRDFMAVKFKKDLADSITWQLLPLGAKAPEDAVTFMKVDREKSMAAAVEQFLEKLRGYMDEAEEAGSDLTRVATTYNINMQSVNKMTTADLAVAVSQGAEGRVFLKKVDPNASHPFRMTELLANVNKRRTGRTLNSHDLLAVSWKDDLRSNQKYAWKHEKGASHVWSGEALTYLTNLTDEYYDEVRLEYREHLREQNRKK